MLPPTSHFQFEDVAFLKPLGQGLEHRHARDNVSQRLYTLAMVQQYPRATTESLATRGGRQSGQLLIHQIR
jgi:hypothetical protein